MDRFSIQVVSHVGTPAGFPGRNGHLVHNLRIMKSGCSVSRGRPHKEDKRMVPEYTHGLFIT
jgi:hypothetical protein